MSKFKKFTLGFIVFLVLAQLYRPSKVSEPVDATKEYLSIANVPAGVAATIRTSCYDCHSNQPKYPSYYNVAPVSWYMNNHIKGGLKKLNFSEWTSYDEKKQNHLLEEIVEVINDERMPLKSYVFLHPDAEMGAAQKSDLLKWVNR